MSYAYTVLPNRLIYFMENLLKSAGSEAFNIIDGDRFTISGYDIDKNDIDYYGLALEGVISDKPGKTLSTVQHTGLRMLRLFIKIEFYPMYHLMK